MSTATASKIPSTSTIVRPLRRGTQLALAAIVAIVVAIALSAWLLAQSPTHHHAKVSPNVSNVQKLGVAGQGGPANLCLPAPEQRFC